MDQVITPVASAAGQINKSQKTTILLPQQPNVDAVSAALAIYFALAKNGKTVKIASASKVQVALPGSEKITSTMSSDGNNLVMSFPYNDGAIDKVDYRIERGQFNLIVIPNPGHPRVTPKDISFSYSGSQSDLYLTVGAQSLQALGDLYTANTTTLKPESLVNIDNTPTNTGFAATNVVSAYNSLSQTVMELIHTLGYEFDDVVSSLLLTGLNSATSGFANIKTTPEDFESAVFLSRAGGKIIKLGPTQVPGVAQPPRPSPQAQAPTPQPRPQYEQVAPTPRIPNAAPQIKTQTFQQPPKPQVKPDAPSTRPPEFRNPLKPNFSSVGTGSKEAPTNFTMQKPKNWFESLEDDFESTGSSEARDADGTNETLAPKHEGGQVTLGGTRNSPARDTSNPLKPRIMGGKDFI